MRDRKRAFLARNTKDTQTQRLVVVIARPKLDPLPRVDMVSCTHRSRYFASVRRSKLGSKSTRANARVGMLVLCSRDWRSFVVRGVVYPCRIGRERDNVHRNNGNIPGIREVGREKLTTEEAG